MCIIITGTAIAKRRKKYKYCKHRAYVLKCAIPAGTPYMIGTSSKPDDALIPEHIEVLQLMNLKL